MDLIISAITHRSGSTLVQRIFNARPQTLIWGEHGGALTRFVELRTRVRQFSAYGDTARREFLDAGRDPNLWIATMTPAVDDVDAAVKAATRALLERLYRPTPPSCDRVGFKEVRYGAGVLQLLRECYPGARIVLLVRDPIETWRSIVGFETWSFGDDRYASAERFARAWVDTATEYLEWHQRDRDSLLVSYERLTERDAGMVSQVAEAAGVSSAAVTDVLSRRVRSGSDTAPPHSAPGGRAQSLIRSACRAKWQDIQDASREVV